MGYYSYSDLWAKQKGRRIDFIFHVGSRRIFVTAETLPLAYEEAKARLGMKPTHFELNYFCHEQHANAPHSEASTAG